MTAKEDAGSVAVVTGGASGIGLGCAMALAAKGFNLALVDVLEAELKEATGKLRATGVRAAKALANKVPEGISLGRFGTPEDIGEVVAFLARAEPNFITGQAITVDGFQSIT